MKKYALLIALALAAGTSEAGEIVAAIGSSDISVDSARDAGVAELSYRFGDSEPGWRPEASLVAYDAGYVFAGAGAVARHDLNDRWFAEGGAQLGIVNGPEGDNDPGLRAYVSLGRELGTNTRFSVGVARVFADGASLDSATLRLHLDY